MMAKHYMLFFLFYKDKEKNLLSEQQKYELLKKIEKFYKELKPP